MIDLVSAINLTSRWDDDLVFQQLDEPSLFAIFQHILLIQKFVFVYMSLLSVYFSYRIGQHSLMHKNFRIILCSGSLFGIVFSGSRHLMYEMLNSSSDLKDRTSCNIVCMFLGILNAWSIMSLVAVMFLGGIERQMATVWVRNYHEKGGTMGFLMVGLTLFSSLIISTYTNTKHLYVQFDLKTTYQSCIFIEYYPQMGFISFVSCIISCSISALWQYYLYRLNCNASRRGTGVDPLLVRCQQNENVHTTRLIFPAQIGYVTVCCLGLFISRKRYEFLIHGEVLKARILLHIAYIIIDTFIIIFVSFILGFHPGLRSNVKRDFYRLFNIKIEKQSNLLHHRGQLKVGIKDEARIYFEQLEAAWK